MNIRTVAFARCPRDGFTLLELLVVMGIIALLMGLLLQSLARVRSLAREVACQSNLKQLMTAVVLYASENRDYLPFPNVGLVENRSGLKGVFWGGAGWLYQSPARSEPDDVMNGVLWPYLRNRSVYHCPNDTEPWKWGSTNVLSSYMMNGAACGFGRVAPAYKLSWMKSDWVCFVEADDLDVASEPTWDDGCVDPEDGNSARHRGGSYVGCFDSHVEWISQADYDALSERKPSRVWCSPGTPTGE